MTAAPAEVLRVGDGKVWVRLKEREGGCGRCDEPGGCRSTRITDAFGTQNDVFALESTLSLKPGDRVKVVIPDGGPLRAALMGYGLGAVLTLAGAAVGHQLAGPASSDAGAGLGVVAGLLLCVLLNRLSARSRTWRSGLRMSLEVDAPECMMQSHTK